MAPRPESSVRPDGAAGVLRLAAAELLAVLAPPLCPGCGVEPRSAIDVLCERCDAGLERLAGVPTCRLCAQPLPCGECVAVDAPWTGAFSACSHEGTARELVVALKLSGARRLASAMAAEMLPAIPPGHLESAVFVPVESHPRHRRSSGVEHAFELARALGRSTGRPIARPLRRVGRPSRQAGATRPERRRPGRVMFEVDGRVARRVVLVDDVHTSGVTLRSAASTLLSAGCGSVSCVTFARALERSPVLQSASGW